MRELTSAAANKLLKALEDEKSYYLEMEADASIYVLAEGEKVEAPEYDYEATQQRIDEIDEKIRKIKHVINGFNTTTYLEPLSITIDEALVQMAQLNRKKMKLDTMRKRLPKSRVKSDFYNRSNLIEYEYVNYEVSKVQEDYQQVCDQITSIQMALDLINQTKVFSVDL